MKKLDYFLTYAFRRKKYIAAALLLLLGDVAVTSVMPLLMSRVVDQGVLTGFQPYPLPPVGSRFQGVGAACHSPVLGQVHVSVPLVGMYLELACAHAHTDQTVGGGYSAFHPCQTAQHGLTSNSS